MKYVLLAGILLSCRLGSPKKELHIINLSLPRTATTSFAGIFQHHKATHEFLLSDTILKLLDFREKRLPFSALESFMRERERQARHQVDSASFYFLAPEAIVKIFPDAKYFLSVRHCESWIVSMVDNSVFAHKMLKEGRVKSDIRFLDRYSNVFINDHSHETFNDLKKLARDSEHVVKNLAAFWGENNLRLLDAILRVPGSERLIIRTENFSGSVAKIADFAGISPASLNTANLHLNKDRDLDFFRNLLGVRLLKTTCDPQEVKLNGWLTTHRNEVELDP